jgi:DedD protein
MDPELKRRLVGTVIIVSLAVIFVPMLFEDKDDLSQDSRETRIPEFPKDFDSQVIPLPEAAPEAKNLSGTTILPGAKWDERRSPEGQSPGKDFVNMDAQSLGRSPNGKDAASKSAPETGADEPAVPPAAHRHDTLDPLDVPPGKPLKTGEGEDEMAAPQPGAIDDAGEEGLPAQPPKPPVTPPKPTQAPVTPAAKPAAKLAPEATAKPSKPTNEPALVEKQATPAPKETAAPTPVKKKTLTTAALPKPPAPEANAAPPAPPPTVSPAPPPPAPTPAVPNAAKEPANLSWWMIQAGSFDDEANAKNLKSRLLQAKIPAFSEKVTAPNGVIKYRVRVGPEKERAKAEEVLKRMESEAGVKGMIVSYP